MKQQTYPENTYIQWCDEHYKIIENFDDISATVMDTTGLKISDFHFIYQDTIALRVVEEDEIRELDKHFIQYSN